MSEFSVTGNPNYAARIVVVRNLVDLPNLDNLKGLPTDGFTALVPKSTEIGSTLAVFPAGSALSEAFAAEHDLFRHSYDFESAIMAVWRNHPAPTTRIGHLVREVCATIATRSICNEETQNTQNGNGRLTEDTGRSQSPRKSPLSKPRSGEKTTPEESRILKSDTGNSTELMRGLEGQNSLPSNAERTPEKINTPSTVSLLNGMTSDTLTLEDVANFVRSGGKFSALTTAMTQEWLGDYFVRGVTSLSVDLEITQRVFATLSDTWNGPKFEDFSRNKTPGAVGYLDDNGKVKALKLRGQISSALALPIDGPEGTLFDTIDGVVVSQKWVNPNAKSPQVPGQKKVRVSFDLPEHFDTASWFRNKHLISDDTYVTVTQKQHGTSLRVSRLPLETPLKWWERLLGRTPKKAFVPVIGSRRTIKFAGEPREGAEHFYGEGNDIWSKAGLPIAEVIPDGVIVYAEIIGYVGDTPIQPGYTYMHNPGEFSTYVYRVVVGGFDLSWDALKQFCESRGLKYVPELWRGLHRDFDVNAWMDVQYHPYVPDAVPLDPKSPCDEGVTVRAEGITPLVLKAKSPLFLVHEGHSADAGRADIEEEEGVA